MERFDVDSAEVTTAQPAARGERLLLQLATGAGELTVSVAHVVSCTPACDDGMQWRLILSLVPSGAEAQAAG